MPNIVSVCHIGECRVEVNPSAIDESDDLTGHCVEVIRCTHIKTLLQTKKIVKQLSDILYLKRKKVNIADLLGACLNSDVMAYLWQKTVSLQDIKKLPEAPGVYFFLGAHKKLLYIGKATILRDRVRSYFVKDIAKTRGPKIVKMLSEARRVGYRQVDSVLEALIIETNLIKKEQPPYNTDAKDDKSYNHIVITQEKFPRVLLVRGRDIEQKKFTDPVKYIFGPFPHGMQLREALKIVRHLFPYRDRCIPDTKRCFSAQIGLCPGVCDGTVSARAYARTINHIRLFFEGKKGVLIRRLEQEMQTAAKKLEFERAQEIKKTLFGLRHIQDMALLKSEQDAVNHEHSLRIEAYDVAHFSGGASVGVMTVMTQGRPDTDAYRMFRLRKKHGGNDLSALEEMFTRRLQHPEWGTPDILVVDGSFLQLGVAEKMFVGTERPLLVGVVKDERHQPKEILGLPRELEHLRKNILLANSEAHRFALAYHRTRRAKEFLR